MGRLEDELERIRLELESLDLYRASSGREREEQLREVIGAIQGGGGLDDYDPEEVERVREILHRVHPAAMRVLHRLSAKGWTLREDGTWGHHGTV